MSKTTGFATERTKPFPITELNFSGNEITKVGIAAVVQFARTQGSDATHVDLSRNRLDDAAATDEVTRLVKNYSSFAVCALFACAARRTPLPALALQACASKASGAPRCS